jgi:1-acyl-sn-glycerol-3-phosphate acyltransferase
VHFLVYMLSRAIAKAIFAVIAKTHVLHAERTAINGPLILASNHISHFDPPAISVAARRKIDWMAMVELFQNSFVAVYLRLLDAFPTDRARVDRTAVRTALKRLENGRVVGLFPEGGIRSGKTSVLNGAPMKAGVASFAQLARVPVLPCVIVGTDRLYNMRNWMPLRRTSIWICFGEPITIDECEDKDKARLQLREKLGATYRDLLTEMRATFQLTDDDLPQTAQERQL